MYRSLSCRIAIKASKRCIICLRMCTFSNRNINLHHMLTVGDELKTFLITCSYRFIALGELSLIVSMHAMSLYIKFGTTRCDWMIILLKNGNSDATLRKSVKNIKSSSRAYNEKFPFWSLSLYSSRRLRQNFCISACEICSESIVLNEVIKLEDLIN